MKKLTKTQIAARLKKAGLTQIAQPNDEQFERKNTFWFEGRDLVVATDRSKNKALKVLATDGHTFGGFACGWGGWVLREDYTSNPLVDANID